MKRITNPDNNMWRSTDPPQRTERVAARIGGGGLKVIDREHGLSDKSGSVFKQSLEQINDRILENNDIECIANGLSSNDKLTIDMNEVPERLQAKLITDYDKFRHTIADAQSIHHNEPDVYFYHSDHLGSASWITDNGGLAVQHLQYLPYGERYVDQRISGYSERFTFTGKERDEETGYGYFGARYMDHEVMTMWLSVDPMADKYPNISPYAYCAWNPVKLVDPNGEDIWEIDKKGNIKWKERSNDNILYSIDENGKRGNKVEISDQEILKQLTKTNGKYMIQHNLEGKEIDKFYAYVAMSDNKEDMAKLFVFFSENTSNCEWSIYSTKDGHCGIGSFRGKRDRSPSPGTIGLKGEIKTMIHSHLDLQPNMNDEKESAFGDRCVSMGVNCNYYLYAPKTKRLWQKKKEKLFVLEYNLTDINHF